MLSDFGSHYIRNQFDSIGSFKQANQGTAENNFAAFLTQFESLNAKSLNSKSINAKESIGKSIGSFQIANQKTIENNFANFLMGMGSQGSGQFVDMMN